jgi:hypothetical protein
VKILPARRRPWPPPSAPRWWRRTWGRPPAAPTGCPGRRPPGPSARPSLTSRKTGTAGQTAPAHAAQGIT